MQRKERCERRRTLTDEKNRRARWTTKRVVCLAVSLLLLAGSIAGIAFHLGDKTPFVCLACIVPNVLGLFGALFAAFPKQMIAKSGESVRKPKAVRARGGNDGFAALLPAVCVYAFGKGFFTRIAQKKR